MSYLIAAWAWFSGLGWVAKAATVFGGLSPALAFLNPVLTVFGIVWTAIKTAVSWVFQALELIATHPVILSVVFLAYVGGRWHQHHYDDHLIEAAKTKAAIVVSKIQGAADVEAQKAQAAIAARDAAEKEAKKIAAEAQAKVFPLASFPAPAPDKLRDGKGNRRRPECEALWCPKGY